MSSSRVRQIVKKALAAHTVPVVACPVYYSENDKLTEHLGKLVEYF